MLVKIGVFWLLVILFFLILIQPAYSDVVIPAERLFVSKLNFWDRIRGRDQKPLEVVAQIQNTQNVTVKVRAVAYGVSLDELGRPSDNGKKYTVDPAITTLYPERIHRFKVRFPARKGNASELANFYVMALTDPKEGEIGLATGGGFLLGCVWVKGSYKPQPPEFTAKRVGDEIRGYVTNSGTWLTRVTIQLVKNNETQDAQSFFVEAGQVREFTIKDPAHSYSAIVLDWLGGKHRVGRRLSR